MKIGGCLCRHLKAPKLDFSIRHCSEKYMDTEQEATTYSIKNQNRITFPGREIISPQNLADFSGSSHCWSTIPLSRKKEQKP